MKLGKKSWVGIAALLAAAVLWLQMRPGPEIPSTDGGGTAVVEQPSGRVVEGATTDEGATKGSGSDGSQAAAVGEAAPDAGTSDEATTGETASASDGAADAAPPTGETAVATDGTAGSATGQTTPQRPRTSARMTRRRQPPPMQARVPRPMPATPRKVEPMLRAPLQERRKATPIRE